MKLYLIYQISGARVHFLFEYKSEVYCPNDHTFQVIKIRCKNVGRVVFHVNLS